MGVYDIELATAIDNYYFDVGELNNYLQFRIMNKLCTKEEIQKLKFVAIELKSDINDDKSKIKILKKIENLILLSNDQINETNYYSKFNDYKTKNINELSINELYDYIEIIFNYLLPVFSIDTLLTLVNKYFEISGSNAFFIKLINISKENYFSNDERDKLLSSVKKNILKIENEMVNELNKNVVSYDVIMNYFSMLRFIPCEIFSYDEISFFNSICKYFTDDSELRMKIDNIKEYLNLEKLVLDFYEKLINSDKEFNEQTDDVIRKKIMYGDIKFDRTFPSNVINKLNIVFDELEIETGKNIIAIDDPLSPDLDGAFSIEKFDDIYMLNVYVSDVPSFLKKNINLCKEAYNRGNSFYFRNGKGKGNINVDMLPSFLSHKFLSFNSGFTKNAIEFSYIFDKRGNLIFRNVDRKRIRITHGISPKVANEIINSSEYLGLLQDDLRTYKELCKLVCSNSKNKWLKSLSSDNINDLVGFSSILTNYYIGEESDFAIYRDKGIYVKSSDELYTHSTTPLRRFVSDINLAFFLNQNGVVDFKEKDLIYVERNIDEIIEHLNECEQIAKFVERNPSFSKKYVKY